MFSNKRLLALKSHIIKNWMYYSIGLIICFGLKYYYSKAGSDELEWILAPTAWWVKVLSGVPFERDPHLGFVNHALQFIIAPSCSGINFMIITFSTLLFSFLHRMGTVMGRLLWLAISLGLAYVLTVLVNGFRIILSIWFLGLDIYNGWITPERVHMLEGTVIYFVSLFVIYSIAGEITKHFTPGTGKSHGFKWISPLFWYLSVTLGVPLMTRAYRNDGMQFMEHSILIIAVCLTAILLFCLILLLQKAFKNKFLRYKSWLKLQIALSVERQAIFLKKTET